MDDNYRHAGYIIDKAKKELKKILSKTIYDTPENKQAYRYIENLVEKIEDTKKGLNYLVADLEEGVLIENIDTGKFYIKYNDGAESYDLNRGDSLELYYADEWRIGKVEHKQEDSHKGYYFNGLNDFNGPFLINGMIVRIRIA